MADVFNVVNWFKPCTHTLRMKPRNLKNEVTAEISADVTAGASEISISAGDDGTLDATTTKNIKAILDNNQSVYVVFGTAGTLGTAEKRQVYKVDHVAVDTTSKVINKIWITPEAQEAIDIDGESADTTVTFIGQDTTAWDAYVDAGVIGDTGTPIQQNLENTEILDEKLAVFSQDNRVTGFTFTPTLLQVTIPNVLMLVPGSKSVHNGSKSAVKFTIGNFSADKWGLQMVPADDPTDTTRYVTCVNGTSTIDGGAALNIGGNDETKNLQLTFKSDTELIFGDPDAVYESGS